MVTEKRFRVDWILSVLMALLLVGLLSWAMASEIARNPAREAAADLGPYGLVMVRLQTNPYPASPTGTVTLSFILTDSGRAPVEPDSFSFEYGHEGNDQAVGSGTVQPMPDGSGMLMAGAQFPSVGTWWLRVTLAKGGYQDDIEFTIEVSPVQ